MFAWQDGGPADVEVNGKLTRNNVLYVSGEFYSELGQRPALGRLIEPADANLNAPISHVAVISYGFWRSRFGENPAVLGKQILVEGRPFTIIGVTQKAFAGLQTSGPPEITLPLTAFGIAVPDPTFQITSGQNLWPDIIGRLKNGVSVPQARAQLSAIWPGIVAKCRSSGRKRRAAAAISFDGAVRHVRRARAWLGLPCAVLETAAHPMGVVVLMQLVVCVNLASLMLARGAGRMHETSVRLALGAGPLRIATQTLLEGLLLSFAARPARLGFCFLGNPLAVWSLARQALAPITIDLHPDLRVLAFTAAVAVLTAILFGLMPALRSRVSLILPPCCAEDSRLRGPQRPAGTGTDRHADCAVTDARACQHTLHALVLEPAPANLGFERASVLSVMVLKRPGAAKNFMWSPIIAN